MPKFDEVVPQELADMLSQSSDMLVAPLSRLYSLYLSGPLLSPDKYINWFNTIRNAGETDYIRIHINCRGGEASSALQFMRVIAESEATVIASVEGDCMSAATMILLSADQVEISPHSLFMFHNYSGGIEGKGGEMFAQITHLQKWSEDLMRDVYKNFLTEAEITNILANKDIWMNASDVITRIEKRIKAVKKDYKKARKLFESD